MKDWDAAEGISRTYVPTWDILICSIAHRTDMLSELLDEIGRQRTDGVGVHVFRDNLETTLSQKCHHLLHSSEADYVSFVDDDDMIMPGYVESIMAALREQPDYVGFNVLYTINGAPNLPALHSLRHGGWHNGRDALYRDISHLNPIRRTLAIQSTWSGRDDHVCDYQWANGLRELGCVKTEVYIERDLYHYRWRPAESFAQVAAHKAPLIEIPPRPDHGFVTWVEI